MKFSLRICGPKCANCCAVLSVWGIIMLIVLGILFKVGTVELYEDTKSSSDTATNCFIAAAIYGVTLLISLFQKHLNKVQVNINPTFPLDSDA